MVHTVHLLFHNSGTNLENHAGTLERVKGMGQIAATDVSAYMLGPGYVQSCTYC